MTITENIGFIGGGMMAEAMIKGILGADLVNPGQIFVSEPVLSRRDYLERIFRITAVPNGSSLLDRCPIIILAVKPQVMAEVLDEIRQGITKIHLVISIAAGITLTFLEERLANSGCRLVRAMPNTPALVQAAASALSAGNRASARDLEITKEIFLSIGECVVLDECDLDAVTGLSGSGPAYVFSFIEALIDAGVKVGLGRETAGLLVRQTVLGSIKLAMDTGKHPASLRDMVTSPGGTTIAGLYVLERAGFSGIIMEAVETAFNRSKELGKQSARNM